MHPDGALTRTAALPASRRAMPIVALVCRLTAWFVLGAGLTGVAFFVRYDGLGVPIAVFVAVLALAMAVLLWAAGRVAAETSRLARALQPPAEPRSRWRRRKADRPAEPEAVPAEEPARRRERRVDAEDAELTRFWSVRRG